jgi:hypothetical protein
MGQAINTERALSQPTLTWAGFFCQGFIRVYNHAICDAFHNMSTREFSRKNAVMIATRQHME